MLLNKRLKFFKYNSTFLFQNNNKCFFIFNVVNFKNKKFLFDFFGYGNVFHISYIKNIYFFENKLKSLFSGNIYVCFIDKINIFDKIFFFNKFFLNVQGIFCLSLCYDNFFFNFNLNYFNLINVIYTNIIIVFYVFLVNLYSFFFKFLFFLRLKYNKC